MVRGVSLKVVSGILQVSLPKTPPGFREKDLRSLPCRLMSGRIRAFGAEGEVEDRRPGKPSPAYRAGTGLHGGSTAGRPALQPR